MKKLNHIFILSMLVWGATVHSEANANVNAEVLAKTISRVTLAAQTAANLINWKVGDFHKFSVKFLFGGGDGTKSVVSEDSSLNAVWIKNEMTLMGQKTVTDTLVSRADGSALKVLVNGVEQAPAQSGGEDQSTSEIVEQFEDTVKVPAGTFKAMYVKIKNTLEGKDSFVEVWVNPSAIGLDGQIKVVAQTEFGPLTLEVTAFKIN